MPSPSRRDRHPRGPTFLTNYAHVLLAIAADPGARMRDVAVRIGITEPNVQRIVTELAAAGYLTIRRVGRRNRYTVNADLPLGSPGMPHRTVGDLLELAHHGVAAG